MAQKKLILVDVTSDILCPFCWIGKRALEEGMRKRAGQYTFRVVWHPFFLRPEKLPDGGLEKLQAYSQKFGREKAEFLLLSDESPVRKHGRMYGLEFNYTPGCVINNTQRPHRLLWWAKDTYGWEKQNELQEVLFRQFFKDNLDPAADATLLAACNEVGVDADKAADFLASGALEQDVMAYYAKMQRRGVSGVPHFSISAQDGAAFELSGAQPSDQFARVFDHVASQ